MFFAYNSLSGVAYYGVSKQHTMDKALKIVG